MGGLGDAIKYLYEKLILRDVLSFITPGAMIVVTATYLLFPKMFSYYIHCIPWPLYIPLFGLFFTAGFAAQCLGEILGMRMKREMKSTLKQRVNILKCKNWDDDSNIWWKDAFKRDHNFFKATKWDEGAQQGRERLVVLKQMCGNMFIAGVIAVIFLIIDKFTESRWFLLIVGVPLFISLFWGRRVHLLRQWSREEVTIKEYRDVRRQNG
jgi:hypothetical protein